MIFNMYAALYLFLHNDTRIMNSNRTKRNIEWNLFSTSSYILALFGGFTKGFGLICSSVAFSLTLKIFGAETHSWCSLTLIALYSAMSVDSGVDIAVESSAGIRLKTFSSII